MAEHGGYIVRLGCGLEREFGLRLELVLPTLAHSRGEKRY